MEAVLFDPGYSSCVLGISDNLEFIYSTFQSSYMSQKQKKFQFSLLLPKIKTTLKQNIAFYLGCLLWASYLKTIKNTEVIENPCLNEGYDEETSTRDSKYLIEFITKTLDRDSKYYIGKPYEYNPRDLKILESYIEFIKLNKGFVELKNTNDIILPSNLKNLDEENKEIVKNKIEDAIKEKNLSILYDVYDLILD